MLALPSDFFEMIISFEAIEHLEDANQYLQEVGRALREKGVFILSTPNRLQSPSVRNPFHKREYTLRELRQVVAYHFDGVTIYGQD